MPKIILAVKTVGSMALENFCPRCFWIKHKAKLPYQIFPGIFSSIDAYTKRCVHAYIDRYGLAPPWIPDNDKFCGYDKAPHYSKYAYQDPITGIIIRGNPDDLLVTVDKTHAIPDYKTAKYTENQDKLLPMYEIQLIGYAIINEAVLNVKVSDLFIPYCEPLTDEKDITPRELFDDGFAMNFRPTVWPVEKDFSRVFALLKKAKKILSSPMPAGVEGCPDCSKLQGLIEMIVTQDVVYGKSIVQSMRELHQDVEKLANELRKTP